MQVDTIVQKLNAVSIMHLENLWTFQHLQEYDLQFTVNLHTNQNRGCTKDQRM